MTNGKDETKELIEEDLKKVSGGYTVYKDNLGDIKRCTIMKGDCFLYQGKIFKVKEDYIDVPYDFDTFVVRDLMYLKIISCQQLY